MHRKAVPFMLACICASTSAFADPAKSAASTSLCGDSYVLALAPQAAVALSWQSQDRLSGARGAARDLPQIWDDPEVLAVTEAGAFIFGPGEGARAGETLRARGAATASLSWREDFDGVYENLRSAGAAMGIPGRAERLINDIEQRRAALRAAGPSKSAPNILYLSRAGGTAGKGTFVDAAIDAAGGQNLITASGWQTLDVEAYVSMQPDLIISSFFSDGYESAQALPIRHKAMRHFLSQYPSAEIPGKLWPCAGPQLIDAAEQIALAIRNLRQMRAEP